MKKSSIFLVMILLLVNHFLLISQVSDQQKLANYEIPKDKYVFVDRSKMPKAKAFSYQRSSIFTTQVNIDVGGNDIVGDAANEPSIAFDPTNPNKIVIGWRQFDNINNDFRQAGFSYSTDAGVTWTSPEPIDAGVFRSDPVLDFDANGNIFYNSLTHDGGDFVCDVYKSVDGGATWDNGTDAQGGDKQWMRIDKTDGIGSGNNYSFWNSIYSVCYPGAFTRSTDEGVSYEDCVSVSGDPRWGTLAVDSAGDLYMVGTGQYTITLVKSTNSKDPNEVVAWDFTTSVNLDGELSGWDPINPQGLIGQAWVDTDNSGGPGQGNVYVLASVNRSSNSDPADVMFARSTDGGVSFEAPVQINTDGSTNNHQWFGTMSVAPNGRIDVVWLDTRGAPTGSPHNSALYYSYSIDQGTTWSDNEELSDYFDPHVGYPQQQKMGDYFDMKSDEGGAHLAWANTFNGGQDVYYAYITPTAIGIDEISVIDSFSVTCYPNPFTDKTTLSFSLRNDANVNISIYNMLGKELISLLDENLEQGKHKIEWSGKNDEGNQVAKGIYLVRIEADNNTVTRKVVLRP